MLNLTKVYGKVKTIKKNLYYGNDTTLKLYRQNVLILELKDNWFLRTHADSNLATGSQEIELTIADVDNLFKDAIFKSIDIIVINGIRYKREQYETPKTGSKVWRFRLTTSKV